MSSLTEIKYLQIEPSEKGIHTNESIMLKMFVCTDSPHKQSVFDSQKKLFARL